METKERLLNGFMKCPKCDKTIVMGSKCECCEYRTPLYLWHLQCNAYFLEYFRKNKHE